MDVWIVSIFFVVIMNNTSMNVCVQILCGCVFLFLIYIRIEVKLSSLFKIKKIFFNSLNIVF